MSRPRVVLDVPVLGQALGPAVPRVGQRLARLGQDQNHGGEGAVTIAPARPLVEAGPQSGLGPGEEEP
eukprot:13512704-Alexandrium_andersonii.AAC.1